jgi:hypothetical protein
MIQQSKEPGFFKKKLCVKSTCKVDALKEVAILVGGSRYLIAVAGAWLMMGRCMIGFSATHNSTVIIILHDPDR